MVLGALHLICFDCLLLEVFQFEAVWGHGDCGGVCVKVVWDAGNRCVCEGSDGVKVVMIWVCEGSDGWVCEGSDGWVCEGSDGWVCEGSDGCVCEGSDGWVCEGSDGCVCDGSDG